MHAPTPIPQHGGPDAQGAARYDFSTNANACGPCPYSVQTLQAADRSRYPDPAYSALRQQLADFHGVGAERVVVAASASEFIHRISAYAARTGLRHAMLPPHSYGDYARAAQAWGLQIQAPDAAQADAPALHWACEPASPLGGEDAALAAWAQGPLAPASLYVLDCAYAPLRLQGPARPVPTGVWQMWTPNKALGLTGVRAAYAIAPEGAQAQAQVLQALAPSWPVGADGVALLGNWVQAQTQAWLAQTLPVLRGWKALQLQLCAELGWQVLPGSLANYFTARLPQPMAAEMPRTLQTLRAQGIQLRDCASFGLPGCVRVGVLGPIAQQALGAACMKGR